MTALQQFRSQIDDFLGNHPQSPLSWEQQASFSGLSYYPENEELAFEVDVDRFAADEPLIEMQTSTGDTRQFRRWGSFRFQVDGEEASLVIYSDPYGHEFFLPFKDATNGSETYGAGRYMDDHRPALQQIGPARFRVDFNFAYNPYCAYSPHFSCPLPPRENWLKVPVQAGEKKFEQIGVY